jgi:hypothetical protein
MVTVADPIREWLAAFPYQDAQARLDRLERQRDTLETEIGELRRYLAMAGTPPEIEGQTTISVTATGNGHHPQGMDAVEIVMRERAGTWTRGDIHRELVRRGWIAEGEIGRRTLGSIMNRMVKRERVKRVRHGQYRLPAPTTREALAA